MNALKCVVGAGVVGAGMLVGAPAEADAGGFSITVGRGYGGWGGYGGYPYAGNYNYGRGFGYGGGYGGSYYGGGYGYRSPGQAVWHDTSHYDYHPGGLVPHGNHFHYIPGHYDYHQQGHYDYYGPGHFGGH